MHRIAIALLGAVVAALLPAGCGSSGTSCPAAFTPCGGSLVGTWNYQTACGASSLVTMSCPGATSDIAPGASGTFTFNADGTFTELLTVSESGTATLPASCLNGPASCAALDTTSSVSGLNIAVTGCTGTVTQSCTCTFSETGTLTLTGKYTTAGNDVTMIAAGSTTGTPTPYCVSGSALELAASSSTSTFLVFGR
jgi:hypothetical protein